MTPVYNSVKHPGSERSYGERIGAHPPLMTCELGANTSYVKAYREWYDRLQEQRLQEKLRGSSSGSTGDGALTRLPEPTPCLYELVNH